MRELSIVIVNYRSWEYLSKCLSSILLGSWLKQQEVIVVDNFSNDGFINEFLEKFPTIKFVQNTRNAGFAAACNLGAAHSSTPNLLFLNPDTLVKDEPIIAVLDFLKANLSIEMAACLQNGNWRKHLKYFPSLAMQFAPIRSLRQSLSKTKPVAMGSENVLFPDWITGSFIMISKNAFERINGWNEAFWMYSEDTDLCWRHKKAGGKIALLTNHAIEHLHGGASRKNRKTTILTKSMVIQSKHLYISMNSPQNQKMMMHFTLAVEQFFVFVLLSFLFPFTLFIDKLKVLWQVKWEVLKFYISTRFMQ